MKTGVIDRGIRRAVQPLLVLHLKYQVEFRCSPRPPRTRLPSLALDDFVLVLPQMECGSANVNRDWPAYEVIRRISATNETEPSTMQIHRPVRLRRPEAVPMIASIRASGIAD